MTSPIQDMIDTLNRLGKEAPKMVEQSLAPSMKFLQKQGRAALRASGIKDNNRTIWRSIGKKVYKAKGYLQAAKVGIGVGMKNPKQRNYKGETDEQFAARKAKTRNIASPIAHLLSMGTAERSTGYTTRRKKGADGKKVNHDRTGFKYRYTGRILPNPYFRTAMVANEAESMSIFRDTLKQKIQEKMGSTGVVR